MSTASRVASGLHKAVAFTLFGASVVGSGALLVTFGQSMVRRIAFVAALLRPQTVAPRPSCTSDSRHFNDPPQAKFQEHKRVSQMYQLQLDEEKRAAAAAADEAKPASDK